MPEPAGDRPAVYTIPGHRSFADALASGLIRQFGKEPLGLARGRILLPNNRAVRSVTEAFVRASGSGLLLPRLIPIGDPELAERVSVTLEAGGKAVPRAIEPLDRLLRLASIIRSGEESAAEALRMAADLGRTLDALLVEDVAPTRLRTAAAEAEDLSQHWQLSLAKLQVIIDNWPAILADSGAIDLAERRNRLLRGLADRWADVPPDSFTVAAGITTAAPAVAALLSRVARLPQGMVVLPNLSLPATLPPDEWDALSGDDMRGEQTHPQFHLKLLLDRMDVGRGEVRPWRYSGGASSPAARGRAVANAMAAPDFSHKWQSLPAPERRLSGVRLAELPDAAAEAQAIALALRQAIETPNRTAALVTPDRQLAKRVAALLARWDIEADDSAGTALSQTAPGTLLLGIAAAAAEDLAPVPLLALLKHPLVGGGEAGRRAWLGSVRRLDLALRGPRPATGLAGLDEWFEAKQRTGDWSPVRKHLSGVDGLLAKPISVSALAGGLSRAAQELAGDDAWRGPAGRLAAELLAELQGSPAAQTLIVGAPDAVPLLRQLLDAQAVRPPYGGHPRIFIWGLLEARLQHADLVVLGGLNEGVWPGLPAPDPWLPPRVRANLGLPSLEFRIGLSAHDFASALSAPQVLITRARRDSRSPTVASRFLLRLQAMTGGIARDRTLERLVAALDDPGPPQPVKRPMPSPPLDKRPKEIWVTAADRLKADPFAFYARAILNLRELDAVDADHTARWKGSAVHEVFEQWLREDKCDPDRLRPRAEELLASEAIHPLLRALWTPQLLEAIDSLAALERQNRAEGRWPLAAEITGTAEIAGVLVHGRVDRIDRLADGSLVVIDYKTGAPPARKAVEAGFALQLGLLALVARAGGFADVTGEPATFEYWSLAKRLLNKNPIRPNGDRSAKEFLASTEAHFADAARDYLLGTQPFTAKLNPAYAPYGDYDQLMRLEEWYGRG